MITEASFFVSGAGNILVTTSPAGAATDRPATVAYRERQFTLRQDGKTFINVPVEDNDLDGILSSAKTACSEILISYASPEGIVFFNKVNWEN
ncbi:hypothetical protein ACTVH1_18190 [Gluconobacter cerinus]